MTGNTLDNKLSNIPLEYETIFPKEWPIYKHIIGVTLLFATAFSIGYLAISTVNYFYPDKGDKMVEEIDGEDIQMNKFNEIQK